MHHVVLPIPFPVPIPAAAHDTLHGSGSEQTGTERALRGKPGQHRAARPLQQRSVTKSH